MISDNLSNIQKAIDAAARRSGRGPGDVTLIGVTKFADVPQINEAIRAGLRHIAENKVQLAAQKFPQLDLAGASVKRHMIGHLQTNKVRDALEFFDLIHSVDSVKLVNEIEKRSLAINRVTEILVQVDIAQEETKFGAPETDLKGIFERITSCRNVRVLGLMTMAPLTEDRELIRRVFRRCRELCEGLGREYGASEMVRMKHLSMGMTQDFEIAIEEGATMVRVGTALFKEKV